MIRIHRTATKYPKRLLKLVDSNNCAVPKMRLEITLSISKEPLNKPMKPKSEYCAQPEERAIEPMLNELTRCD